jgi:hypothetical protein
LQNQTTDGLGALSAGWRALRDHAWRFPALSVLVVIPCVWHRRIEAGDLGSHVYNAWLAQLIERGQAPGLFLQHQTNNILFDVLMLHVANVAGFGVAEQVVVGAFVLIFFWGVFALITASTGRLAWMLTPVIAMLAYGYVFNMGFMNFYVSIGLGCVGLALVWNGRGSREWPVAVLFALLAYVAHPLGFLWLVALGSYVNVRRWLRGEWKLLAPVAAIVLLAGIRLVLHFYHEQWHVDWGDISRYKLTGADQLVLYGGRYWVIAWCASVFGAICCLAELWPRRRDPDTWRNLRLPAELYFLAFFATLMLPENLKLSMYAAWIGLLVSRLTVLTAVMGLCLLGIFRLGKWQIAGFGILAAVYFSFLYRDTSALNRVEVNADAALSTVPYGTRIIPMIYGDPNWRVEFIGHLADRACVGRCFVYSNYEPSSKQFRVRVNRDSRIATDSADDAEDMQAGSFEISEGDLPLKQLYQCEASDWTKLCLRDLKEGDNTGDVGRTVP